ncbi:MAG: hypothetical protein NT066_00555, partial [Candidatus Omnitrophica bacterium]|nr:hypothetical protein [Candidatus Omnitrophota bacterium]
MNFLRSKGGIFAQKIDTEVSQEEIEKEYYDLQEQLQKKITELLPEFGFAENRYSVLTLLSYLIKEASTIMEVEQAQEGLVSYLKTPGPGLEKSEGEEVTILLRNFVDKKSGRNLNKIEEEAVNILKESPFNIQARIAIRSLIHKIQNSALRPQVLEYEKQLQETIDNSSLNAISKGELKKLAGQLKEWKILGLRQRNVSYEGKPLEEKKIEEFPVEGAGSRLEKEYLEPPEKYAQIKKTSLDIAKILGSFIKITVGGFFLLILCIPLLLFILYFLTERQKNKLISSSRDPRVFIINLYENLRQVLVIFGARYSEVVPPLFYASWIEQRYSIENNLFLKLTKKFEEAKYSQHILAPEGGDLALNDYNDFLKALLASQNKFSLVLRHCLILLRRRPLFVY